MVKPPRDGPTRAQVSEGEAKLLVAGEVQGLGVDTLGAAHGEGVPPDGELQAAARHGPCQGGGDVAAALQVLVMCSQNA